MQTRGGSWPDVMPGMMKPVMASRLTPMLTSARCPTATVAAANSSVKLSSVGQRTKSVI